MLQVSQTSLFKKQVYTATSRSLETLKLAVLPQSQSRHELGTGSPDMCWEICCQNGINCGKTPQYLKANWQEALDWLQGPLKMTACHFNILGYFPQNEWSKSKMQTPSSPKPPSNAAPSRYDATVCIWGMVTKLYLHLRGKNVVPQNLGKSIS